MYLPHSYVAALLFMLCSMVCWGSWANTMKLAPGYRFQLFYWDYVWGMLLGALLWGFTLGSLGHNGPAFVADLSSASHRALALAALSGVLFNVANLLLVAAIEIAGMAVAFPIGIGLALVLGTVGNYAQTPQGNPMLLFGGVALVMVAMVCDAMAYRAREAGTARTNSARGIVLSLVAGLLMGSFYPVLNRAMSMHHGVGPYAAALPFMLGVAVCALVMNALLMRFPVDGNAPVAMRGYWSAPSRWHGAGVLGGAIWACGGIANFVASRVNYVGPAVSYSIGQGATLVSMCWGVFVWKEFAQPTSRIRILLTIMFACFVAGLTAIGTAPLF